MFLVVGKKKKDAFVYWCSVVKGGKTVALLVWCVCRFKNHHKKGSNELLPHRYHRNQCASPALCVRSAGAWTCSVPPGCSRGGSRTLLPGLRQGPWLWPWRISLRPAGFREKRSGFVWASTRRPGVLQAVTAFRSGRRSDAGPPPAELSCKGNWSVLVEQMY